MASKICKIVYIYAKVKYNNKLEVLSWVINQALCKQETK